MARFNKGKVTSKVKTPKGPIVTGAVPTTRTALGAPAYTRDSKSELFLLGVANFVGQDTYYEKATDRDARFKKLVHSVALNDPAWLLSFVTWLRNDGNMRSASLVAGLEGAAALHGASITDGHARKLVSAPLLRADEVGEALGYWAANYSTVKAGKPIHLPKPVKRGLADAAVRLYNEHSLLKYDTASHGVRFGDVLELTHPAGKAPWQEALFKFAIDSRHGRGVATDALAMVQAQTAIRAQAALGNHDSLLDTDRLRAAGMTWEDALSLAGSKVPKAKLWEAMLPAMGYMALLRNLRNFDQAGLPDKAVAKLIERLADPEQVAKSRQLPLRFLSAYEQAPSLRWGHALDKALQASLDNIPTLGGRTLVLVDTSGSMNGRPISEKSTVTPVKAAAIFGVALAAKGEKVDLCGFADGVFRFEVGKGASVIREVSRFVGCVGKVGHGTDIGNAVRIAFKGHDRVVIISDMQTMAPTYRGSPIAPIPEKVPVYGFNLMSYRPTIIPGGAYRHEFGGLTDHTFSLIPLLEQGRDGSWPWDRAE